MFAKGKKEREFVAPLGDVEQLSASLEINAMDITGPYLLTPQKSLLTFTDQVC